MEKNQRNIFMFLVLILSALVMRVICILISETVNGDSAILALMAKHVAELRDFPIYMPRVHYVGSLMVYVGAILFKVFGVSSITYGFLGLFTSCLWVIFIALLARRTLDRSGYIFTILLALFPNFNLLLFSLSTWGVHAENFVFVSLLLLLLIKWNDGDYRGGHFFSFLFGLCSGAGFWSTPGVIPCLLTIFTVFIIKSTVQRSFSAGFFFFAAGFLLGYMPSIIYNLQFPMATIFRMGGRILDLDRSVLSSPDIVHIVFMKILWRISTFPASLSRIPRLIHELIGMPNLLLFVVSIVWVYKSHFLGFLKERRLDGLAILMIFVIWFVVFYVTLVGEDAARYMSSLCAISPVLIGGLLSRLGKRSKTLCISVVMLVLLYNICTTAYSFSHIKVMHYPELAKWLLSRDMRYGYSDSRISYAVEFDTSEKILISPTIFHPDFSDRWPEETSRVRAAENTIYILNRNFPEALAKVQKRFRQLSVAYKKDVVEEFVVYHDLSRRVYPEELGLIELLSKR